MTASVSPTAVLAVLREWGRTPPSGSLAGAAPTSLRLGELSFEDAVMQALQSQEARTAPNVVVAEESRAPHATAPESPGGTSSLPSREAAAIVREASRARIDPALLAALRRTENGRPGREFGVLSVPAEGLDAQTRVAANTVRNTIARFEQAGGVALDPTTGRYTEAFLRFLSSRYAPCGAANDPAGLNRHHAVNLIALYWKASDAKG
ncbi:MAG TPA: hypothetical protein VLH09_10790 [Bryobacteraceae bacterium]|nr:hypothetical protein [Bryobacteraceae bacterium]